MTEYNGDGEPVKTTDPAGKTSIDNKQFEHDRALDGPGNWSAFHESKDTDAVWELE